jgi:hypothetical protein
MCDIHILLPGIFLAGCGELFQRRLAGAAVDGVAILTLIGCGRKD